MGIVIPIYIKREFIQNNPQFTFVHSADYWNKLRVGPAGVCAGLPNCFGVAVRWRLCKSSGYFSDSNRDIIMARIDKDIAKIPRDKPIILFPKIGSGHSLMYKFAPICFKHLSDELNKIKAEYKYDYYATA